MGLRTATERHFPVTERQKEVLRLIVRLSLEHRRPPTLREISAGLGLAPTGCRDHLARLLHKGQIQHVPFSCRTMKLTDAGYQTIGLWCPVCESVALELYAIPNAFTVRCIPCARASLRIDEVATLVT